MDYQELTDDELSIEIAKTKGWRAMTWINQPNSWTLVNQGSENKSKGYATESEAWAALREVCPIWPKSYEAAWELLEEMNQDEELRPIELNFYAPGDGYGIYVGFFNKKIANAATAMRAICIAYLNWKTKKEIGIDGLQRFI
jgi:hypothetical protein